MKLRGKLTQPGIAAALAAALLFGAATPLAARLVGRVDPWLLAALLYLGSGLGISLYRALLRTPSVELRPGERRWLAGAILAGGIVAPVLLMFGLTGMPASAASLLLNAESVFTVLIAWLAFREGVDRRIATGMLAICTGAVVLSWPGEASVPAQWPALAVLGACLAWAVDNNLTRKVSLADASRIAGIKGLVAGAVNLLLAMILGAALPNWADVAVAMTLGLFSYGMSLTLFIVALRHLGTARTSAYFSIAPFFGALLALWLGDPMTPTLLVAGALMLAGVWLHVTEHHKHAHSHPPLEHEHEHVHDQHHQHTHDAPLTPGVRHTHRHQHPPLRHTHAHFPDAHHRHDH